MINKNILIVEDEEHLIEALKLNFELEGYTVTCAKDGKIALDKAKKEYYDLIILDVMLPEIDGFTVAETLRVQQNNTPILMLSAKGSTEDKIIGLKKGADDYLTKPFNLEELLIRVKKLIEKNEKILQTNPVIDNYSFGNNTINFKTLEAKGVNQQNFTLSKKEIMLLKLLIENGNTVVSREKILQTVWNYQVYPTTRTIDNFILNFRKYFEVDSRNPKHFHSIRGIGYKFTT
jgi:two-component system, OmpR family, alkaline phosphatase synthesis response regulator PhoP